MFRELLLFAALSAISSGSGVAYAQSTAEASVPDGATPVRLWATNFYALEGDASQAPDAVPLRNLQGEVIGPSLTPRGWCAAAMEGTVLIDGAAYNYAGAVGDSQTDCRHDPSERVRWIKTPHAYGLGSNNNPLEPFVSIACDLGTVANSTPWLNGGFPRFGQKILVPEAKGVELPDGSVHDGIFVCADIGGLITGNHIDVFVGGAKGERDAGRKNPFSFVKHNRQGTFEAFVLP